MWRFTMAGAVVIWGLLMMAPQRADAQLPSASNPRTFVQKYLYNRPTVSPYLNLLRFDQRDSGIPNYQTLVRPMLEQRERNRAAQKDISRLQSQVGSLRSDFVRSQQNQAGFRTGHPTRFMTYSHFYPAFAPK